MRYYIDTEFSETLGEISLLSIAIVSEDARELYIEIEQKTSGISDFARDNVIPNLLFNNGVMSSESQLAMNRKFKSEKVNVLFFSLGNTQRNSRMREKIKEFVGSDPEFWGYFCDYDWVLFCAIFGTMADLPEGWPMLCRDLKQFALDRNIEVYQDDSIHNALYDARWIAKTHADLLDKEKLAASKASTFAGQVGTVFPIGQIPLAVDVDVKDIIMLDEDKIAALQHDGYVIHWTNKDLGTHGILPRVLSRREMNLVSTIAWHLRSGVDVFAEPVDTESIAKQKS